MTTLKNLIINELVKMWLNKKIIIFLLVIIVITLLPLVTLVIPEVSIAFNGQNYALLMLQNLVMTLLPLLTIVMLVEMFSNEYEKGLIKNTLIQPVTRTQVLISKYLSVLIVNGALLFFSFVYGTLVGMLIFGSGTGILTSKGVISGLPALSLSLSAHVVSLLPIAAFAAVVLLLVVLINSGTTALTISIAAFFGLALSGQLLTDIRQYLITGQLELYLHIIEPGLLGSLLAAIMVILIWGGAAFILAYSYFIKKQIYQ